MIVRISGEGQYELDDEHGAQLDRLDQEVTDALHSGDEQRFHQALDRSLAFVRESGTEIGADRIVSSDVILPPEDVTLDEASRYFSDEGRHMEPVIA